MTAPHGPNLTVVYSDVEQGGEAWRALRRGVVTASTIGALITPKTKKVSTSKTAESKLIELAAERITDFSEDSGLSRDMERGVLDEPYAREAYAEYKGVDVQEIGFMTRNVDGLTIGYSPDGMVSEDGLIEIKSRRQRIQVDTILADQVPIENMAQLQTGLFVAQRDWIDFVSYAGGMPLYVKRVFPDQDWQFAIQAALVHAEAFIAETLDTYYKAVEGLPITERIDHFGDELEIQI